MVTVREESKIVKTDSLNLGKVTESLVLRANGIAGTGYCQAFWFLSRTPLFDDIMMITTMMAKFCFQF